MGREEADEDDRLLMDCARGDAQAFRRLLDRHAAVAHGVARRLLTHPADAEDVVQEAFSRTWQLAGRWRAGGAPFRGWLLEVVANLCRDRQRRAFIRAYVPLDEAPEVADPTPDAEQRLGERREQERLIAAIRALPERQRLVLVLTYAGGLKNAEAAATLKLSVKAVEALLVRARGRLRARLNDACEH